MKLRILRLRHLWSLLGAACLLVALLSSFVVVLVHHDRQAKNDLTTLYATRAELSARFAREYVNDFAAREKRVARRKLGVATVDAATFNDTAAAMEFDAAALVDANGVLLQVWPPNPAILGTNVAAKYDHLNKAVHGAIGISDVVLSASRSVPIVAVAVPYESDVGPRVLSGAFSVSKTPLGAYLSRVSPIVGSQALLIDEHGTTIDTGQTGTSGLSAPDVGKVAQLTAPTGEVRLDGVTYTYAIRTVPRTPWHVVLAAPSTALYQPLNRQSWDEWAVLVAFAITGIVALVLLERLGRARAKASSLARIDPLTGLPNRRAVDEAFLRMAAHANRNGYQLGVLSIDLDNFKLINDTYGHKVGDQALVATGEALRGAVRAHDIAGRWGGEEFLVVLADATRDGTLIAAERIRAAITDCALRAQVPGRVSASVGAAIDHPLDFESLLRTADRALYVAKAQGRDRVHVADDPFATFPELHPGGEPTSV